MDPFFELFPDRYPFVTSEDSHFWWIGLKWPETEEWYVDPNLADQARKSFEFSLAELPTHWERETSWQAGVCLFDVPFHGHCSRLRWHCEKVIRPDLRI